MNFSGLKRKIPKDYPYMYARISAKRAKLLDERDYDDLLKMEPNQIAKRLEEGEYRKEIDQLGARYDGVQLVELALNRNLSNTMRELSEMAPEPLSGIIEVYLRRFDILTLKRLLRWKKGSSNRDSKDMFIPISRYSFEELSELMEKDYEQIVEDISFPESRVDYQGFIDSKELSKVENSLDKAYSAELDQLCQEVPSKRFRKFMEQELEHQNLVTALRLKKYGYEAEEISKHFVNGHQTRLLTEIMEAENLEEAMDLVVKSGRAKSTERLEELEHELEADRLQNALTMVHAEPLGATSIIGYVVAKQIEIKNLRMLIRAKETGLQNTETIKKNLVIA
ncbi:V-type ATPase subunit [Candidatus Nanohalococcus occultus]|uniref:Archaeal/vacuolar-type H -ATPase subunit C n=1 Tax=Candidatus Nanohalococcus occultus TaxID=2978047 RepID=A0ABY8CES8_9ARCH|nr:Archaeal/vacuolar-type H -ATPase subunit C [Candidatus Nanohaloarchaeota archaeon SVXNc]